MLNSNSEQICRLCLSRQAIHEIFTDSSIIIDKINACCALQIFENDGLPDHICEECLTTLDLIASFRNKCEENDRLLRDGLFDIKPVKCEVQIVKVEFSPDDDIDISNYSDDLNDIKSEVNVFKQVKKQSLKRNKRIVNKIVRRKKTTSLNRCRKRRLEDGGLCPFCGKVFFKLASLNVHIKTHTTEKTHTCDTCSKSFRELRVLRDHQKTHLNIKNYPCEECEKLFSTKSSAKKHLELVHKKSKIVFCSLCNKKLSSNRSLKGHMKTHTGEKEFECDFCDQSFAFKCSLVVHLRSHTGEKPYQCKYCDSKFAALKTIKEHERLHTGETPYLCPVCSKGFTQKSNMKSHFRNNHKGVNFA